MRRNWSFILDAVLLTGIVVVALTATHTVLDGIAAAQAVALVTPVTLLPPEPTDTSKPPPPPTATRIPTRTFTPRPSVTRTPVPSTATPLPSPTSTPTELPGMELRPVFFPSVTPNGIMAIGATPIPPPIPTIQMPRGSVTIALLGSDKRPNRNDYRTDTIILANIVPSAPSVTLLSIPRDLWVFIPGYQFHKINVADEQGEFSRFPGGGAGLLKQTIEYNLGIHVDYTARVDFSGFMKIVDTLGGIDVVANCPLEDIFPDDPITENPAITGTLSIERPGIVHLDGKHALWYARSRETTSDWDRSLRQQRVLRAIWNKANQQGLVARLPELWGDLSSTVKTDLALKDILWLTSIGVRLDGSRVKSHLLGGDMVYHWTTPDTRAWVVSPMPDKIGPALQQIFNPPTNIAAQAPVRVEVLNGTSDPAWGVLAADRLEGEGYFVTGIAQADRSDHAQTKIVDMTTTPKGSRRQALASLFRTLPSNIIVQPDMNSLAQYRIIVGADFQPCVRPPSPAINLPTPTSAPPAP